MHTPITPPAALLADPTRAAIVLALMDGRAREAKKLALDAGVTPQTASAHLRKLVDANLLAWHADGRCKYFRIAGAEVAHAVEALCELGMRSQPERALPAAVRPLRFARCCYDHLAGQLGVAITERLPRLGAAIYAEPVVVAPAPVVAVPAPAAPAVVVPQASGAAVVVPPAPGPLRVGFGRIDSITPIPVAAAGGGTVNSSTRRVGIRMDDGSMQYVDTTAVPLSAGDRVEITMDGTMRHPVP